MILAEKPSLYLSGMGQTAYLALNVFDLKYTPQTHTIAKNGDKGRASLLKLQPRKTKAVASRRGEFHSCAPVCLCGLGVLTGAWTE